MDELIVIVNKLILRIANNDKSALGELYERVGGLLFAMAKKYLYDKSKAEDVIAEVFLKLVKGAKTFRKGHNGLNWLFKCVHNEAINTNKKDSRHLHSNIEDYSNILQVIDFDESAFINTDLHNALKLLSTLEQRVLYFKFWECLTIREISKKINMPRSTTQDIVKAALNRIGKILEDDSDK